MNQKNTPFEEIALADSGLKPHDLIAHIPRWEDEDPRALALRRYLMSGGDFEPLKITQGREIIDPDSRERWRAARQLQMATVPVTIVAEEDVEFVAIGTLVNRWHLTKSALAYLVYPMLKPAFEASRNKRLENLKNTNVSRKGTQFPFGNTVEEMARSFGVSDKLLKQAKDVHAIFDRDADYKEQMEPRILAEMEGGEHERLLPMGLGAVIAGHAGRDHTLDKNRRDRGKFGLFERDFAIAMKRMACWDDFDEREKAKARQQLRDWMAAVPESAREDLIQAIEQTEPRGEAV